MIVLTAGTNCFLFIPQLLAFGPAATVLETEALKN